MSDSARQPQSDPRAGHLAWRGAGISCIALAAAIQLWLAGRLGPAGDRLAVAADYFAVVVSFVLAISGIALIVLGGRAVRLLRGED